MLAAAPANISARLMARVLLVEDEPNIDVGVSAARAYETARRFDFGSSRLIRALFELRTLPDRLATKHVEPVALRVDDITTKSPFRMLAERGPVVMMTEFRDTVTPQRARAAGAVATVEKPFKPTQLARLVAQLVPAAAGRP